LKKMKEGRNDADQWGNSTPKRIRSTDIISSVSAAAADRRITARELASSHGLSIGTVDWLLHTKVQWFWNVG